jgi:hypothetical protein
MSRSMTVPTLADNTSYARESATLQRLLDEEARLCAADADLERRLKTDAISSPLDVEAMAKLSDRPADDGFTSVTRQELARVRHDKGVTRRAIQMQKRRVAHARYEASREIIATIRPQYETILAKTRDAILKLKSCIEHEKAFRLSVRDADICFGELRPMGLEHYEDVLDSLLGEHAEYYSAA